MDQSAVFQYGVEQLTPAIALAIGAGHCRGVLSDAARGRIEKSRLRVAELAAGDAAVYGVNTGFGPLCTTRISPEETRTLQRNLIMSHASGMGEPISTPLAKLMLILKAHALCRGHSGRGHPDRGTHHLAHRKRHDPARPLPWQRRRLRRPGPPFPSLPAADRPGAGPGRERKPLRPAGCSRKRDCRPSSSGPRRGWP